MFYRQHHRLLLLILMSVYMTFDITGRFFSGQQPGYSDDTSVSAVASNTTSSKDIAFAQGVGPGRLSRFCELASPDSLATATPTLSCAAFFGTRARVVVGVPTITRPIKQYVAVTLKNLLRSTALRELGVVFVVLVADLDETKRNRTVNALHSKFGTQIDERQVQLVTSASAYHRTLGVGSWCQNLTASECAYAKWRNKQNLDYAQLLAYAPLVGDYYLQLEDDVRCAADLFPKVATAIAARVKRPWVLAEVAKLGFIGKLFPAEEALLLSKYLVKNFDRKACDWLLEDFVRDRSVTLEHKDGLQPFGRITVDNQTLCQHQGTVSSLPGKFVVLK